MRVVLDTSGWYGFVSKDDEFNSLAVNFLKSKPIFLISYPVFEELAAVLHHRRGKKDTLDALQGLRNTNIYRIIYINETTDNEIWKLYKSKASKIDYVDASVVWLAKKAGLPIFTFDTHFKNLGLEVVP